MRAIIDFFLEGVAGLLAFYYSLPVVGGNFGVAIILMTITIMAILSPLTIRATKSSIKMARMQPKLKAIQKKYKDDRPTMNAKVLELYQTEGINPVGGCLPMIAQMPVLLTLFAVLRGVTRKVDDLPYFNIAERAWEETGGAVSREALSPQYLDTSTDLYQDLVATPDTTKFGPLDLSAQAWDIVQSSFVDAIPYVLLILVVVGLSYYQQRQISARRGSNAPAINPQQQMLMRVFPVLTGVWSFIFPAGLVLYWATSNAFRVGQQAYITRAIYSKEEPATEIDIDLDDTEDVIDAEATEASAKELSDREQAWADRRKKNAKKASKGRKPGTQPSNRITPKGTQPNNKRK